MMAIDRDWIISLSDDDLASLIAYAKDELARRTESSAEAVRSANEAKRRAREIMRQHDIGQIKGWSRPGDRRLYISPADDRGAAWGGTRRYPVSFVYLADGDSRRGPGWYAQGPATVPSNEIEAAVRDALAEIGETPESAARNGFYL